MIVEHNENQSQTMALWPKLARAAWVKIFPFMMTAISTKVIKSMVFLGQVQDRRPQEMDFPVGKFRLGV